MTIAVREIPSVNFVFFDPDANKYVTLQSEPIPITVTEAAKIPKPPKSPVEAPQVQAPAEITPIQTPIESSKASPTEQPTPIAKPAPVEIEANYDLNASDINQILFGTWSLFWIFPVWILIVIGQIVLRRYLARRDQIVKPKSSQNVFQEAMQAPFNTPTFFNLLNQAFLLKLVERGDIPSENVSPDALSTAGYAGKVREFLTGIEARRFAGDGKLEQEKVLSEAKSLFTAEKDIKD